MAKAVIQRVLSAQVTVAGEAISEIGEGILVLLGVEVGDTASNVEKLAQKIISYRIFADDKGYMNLNVQQVDGNVLVVSQFTIVADTQKGARPSFSSAAAPKHAELMYNHFVEYLHTKQVPVQTGQFAADMQVALINDGPVTFILEA